MNFNKEEKNINNINSNNSIEKHKNSSKKIEKNEDNNIFNKNNNSLKRNFKNNNSKYLHNYNIFQNDNDNFNLFSKTNEKNERMNSNIFNNNLSNNNNSLMENMDAPNFFNFQFKSNDDVDISKNNAMKLKSIKRSNSYVKKSTNYSNNYSDLNKINLENYKIKIESEVKKLNDWMNDGYFSFHNTYTNNLEVHVENIKKELSTCNKLINYYKKIEKNEEKANIAENLKILISKLISRYDEFIKNNSRLKISRSSFNKSKEINDNINFNF